MSGYRLYQSSDLNAFADLLSAQLAKTPLLKPLPVLVQNKTLEEWLKRSIALRNGVCTNIRFYTQERMRHYLLSLFRLNRGAFADRLIPSSWMWEVLIHSRLFFAPHAGEMNEIQKVRFSAALAQIFEHYDKTRPLLAKAWTEGKLLLKDLSAAGYESWQQPLMADIFRNPMLCRYTEEFEALLESGEKPNDPPEALCIIGSVFLNENNFHLFFHASSFMDIHHFLLAPSRTYMGDRNPRVSAEEKTIHPLLNAWGGLFQKHQNFFMDQASGEEIDLEEVSGGTDTLLGRIRSEISEGIALSFQERIPLNPDGSLVVRACPGKSREVEIVYQAILSLLQKNPHLSLADVAVAAPDIDAYVPLIQMVFRTPLPGHEGKGLHLPFYLSRISLEKSSVFLSGFRMLFSLAGTSFRAGDLYQLFQNPCFREKHGLLDEDMELFREMTEALSVKWGIDAKHKKDLGYMEDEDNTWDLAFSRIVLGISMEGEDLFEGILPASSVSFTDYPRLCLMIRLLKQIFSDFRQLHTTRKSIGEWAAECLLWIKKYLAPRENRMEDELHAGELRGILREFSGGQERIFAEEKQTLSFVQFRSLLSSRLKNVKGSTGRTLSDGVTVASLSSIRTVPFRIIFVMGMEEGSFPSREQEESFDLKSYIPSALHASQREVDRYSILELFFSAGESLHFSFCSRDIVKNLDLKPGNVLLELEDYINGRFEHPGFLNAFDALVENHPLLSYDPVYFQEGSSLSSLSLYDYEAAKSMVSRKIRKNDDVCTVSVAQTVQEKDKTSEIRISLEDLLVFVKSPAESFFRTTLGIILREETLSFLTEEDEPWSLDALDQWKFQSEWLDTLLSGDFGADEENFSKKFILRKRAEGKIAGDLFSEEERKKILSQAKQIKSRMHGLELGSRLPVYYFMEGQGFSFPLRGEEKTPPLFFPALVLNRDSRRFIVEGRIDSLFEGGFVRPVGKEPDPKHAVRQWVQYLFLRSHPSVSEKFETLKAWQIPVLPEEEKREFVFHLEKNKAEELLFLLIEAYEKNREDFFPVYFDICRELLKPESPADYPKSFFSGIETVKKSCPYLREYEKREKITVSPASLRAFAEVYYAGLLSETPKTRRRKK